MAERILLVAAEAQERRLAWERDGATPQEREQQELGRFLGRVRDGNRSTARTSAFFGVSFNESAGKWTPKFPVMSDIGRKILTTKAAGETCELKAALVADAGRWKATGKTKYLNFPSLWAEEAPNTV